MYWPQLHQAGTALRGGINLVLTAAIMGALVVVVAEALPGWIRAFRGLELSDETDAADAMP